MGWSPNSGLLVAALLVGVVSVVAAPVVGAPPPRPLCDACGDTFETTARGQGVAVSVERSTATVTVHENGSATWVVRNSLRAGADRLRANTTRRTEIASRAMWDAELLGSAVTPDDVVVLRFREPEFAEPTAGGAMRSGEFTASYGYPNLHGLGADRLTVHAPPGSRIDRAIPGATVEANGTRMTLTDLERQSVVTFVPRDSDVGPLLSLVALASLVGPVVVVNGALLVGAPALLVAGVVSTVDYRTEPASVASLDPGGPGLAAIGAGVVVVSLVGVLLGSGGTAATGVGVGVTLAVLGKALARRQVRELASFRRLCGVAVLSAGVAAAVALGVTLLTRGNTLTWSVGGILPLLGPLFALLPAGYALGTAQPTRGVLTAVAGVVVGLEPFVPLYVPLSGLGWLLVAAAVGTTVTALVLGAPLFLVGVGLGQARADGGPRERH